MFELKNHQTNGFIEVTAGLTTFFSMVYVLAANPIILAGAGLPVGPVFTATVLGTMAATLIMALYANLPFAVAPGMGLNAFFVVMVTQLHYSVAQSLTAVLISGLIFVFLSLSPLRQKVLDEIPVCLQYAVGGGIGLMIAYIGLLNSGVVVFDRVPGIGNLGSGSPLLAICGLLVTGVLLALKFRFAVLAGILIATVIGLPLGVTETKPLQGGFLSLPPNLEDLFFNFDFSVIGSLDFWSVIIALLMMEIVDGMAGFLGLFSIMGRDRTYRHKLGRAFVADSLGVVAGSVLGLSPNTTYGESGTGVAAGGRTGLTALTVVFGFGLALFMSPLFLMVPSAAVAPALVVVGLLMLYPTVTKIDYHDVTDSFPAFVVIVTIALTWHISDSLALGWLAYMLMKTVSGRIRELTLTVWLIGIIFSFKIFY
ncbi:MAG: NCS2 family permease [Deltaproteobacteria bacterium]|jgi:AGZA family xanthine/uracil permease-like MFS transporter|nr:NCS2 family permease [Deltaproteobacteria bacterium]